MNVPVDKLNNDETSWYNIRFQRGKVLDRAYLYTHHDHTLAQVNLDWTHPYLNLEESVYNKLLRNST